MARKPVLFAQMASQLWCFAINRYHHNHTACCFPSKRTNTKDTGSRRWMLFQQYPEKTVGRFQVLQSSVLHSTPAAWTGLKNHKTPGSRAHLIRGNFFASVNTVRYSALPGGVHGVLSVGHCRQAHRSNSVYKLAQAYYHRKKTALKNGQ